MISPSMSLSTTNNMHGRPHQLVRSSYHTIHHSVFLSHVHISLAIGNQYFQTPNEIAENNYIFYGYFKNH
jgi:hypothetical protein